MDVKLNEGMEEYEKEKEKLRVQYQEVLIQEKESGFRFECFVSNIISAFKKRTYKVLFNDTDKGITEEQENVLKKFPKMKKTGNLLIKKTVETYKEELGQSIKDSINEKSAGEVVEQISELSSQIEGNISKAQKSVTQDVLKVLPNINKRLHAFHHYIQNLYEREFCKSRIEKLMLKLPFMGVKFNPNRSLIKRKDSKRINILMNFFVKDIMILGENGEKTSFRELKKNFQKKFKHAGDEKEELISQAINDYVREHTEFGRNMKEVEELIKQGKRIIFTMPHPGYLGALAPRYIFEALGYKDIIEKWTVVSGPRPFASRMINLGARSMGHILMTLPSSDTTPIKTPGLKRLLQLLGIKSSKILSGKTKDIEREDYEEGLSKELFGKKGTEGIIGLFLEGSRSNVLDDGSSESKYCDPGAYGSFIKEGDITINMSLDGTQKILKKDTLLLRRSEVSCSLGKPELVTQETIENKYDSVCDKMEKICALPSEEKMTYPFCHNKENSRIERKDTVAVRKLVEKRIEEVEKLLIDIERNKEQEEGQSVINDLKKYLAKPDSTKEVFEEKIQRLNDIYGKNLKAE